MGLRFLIQERVTSVLLHSLPFCAPSTVHSWDRIRGVYSFASHLLTNNWTLHGNQAITDADLPTPGWLAFRQAALFLHSCLKADRRYGTWLSLEEREGRAVRHRSQEHRSGEEVVVPSCSWMRRHSALDTLQPVRLARLWNALPWDEVGLGDPELRLSRFRFSNSLPALYEAFPATLRLALFAD